MGAVDTAGAGVVHLCGGVAALIAVVMLEPRRGRFDPKFKQSTISNASYIVTGTLLLWQVDRKA